MNKNELYNNGYGGFSEDGKEYILKDIITPTPWSHILTNGRIGTIITNGGGGSTWYINSRENKLTSWSNDTTTDKASEIVYLESTFFSKISPSFVFSPVGSGNSKFIL